MSEDEAEEKWGDEEKPGTFEEVEPCVERSEGRRATGGPTGPTLGETNLKTEAKTQPEQQAREVGESSEVQPQEMFDAVVKAVQGDPSRAAREEWVATVAELFVVAHSAVRIKEDKIPPAKKKYPKLRGEEKDLLFRLFREACVTDLEKYKLWAQRLEKITQELYNSTWSFSHILENHIGKLQWNRQPPLNQWAEKAKAGKAQVEPQTMQHPAGVLRYQNFMLNPAVFLEPERSTLRDVCEKVYGEETGTCLREATPVEWKIIEGIATGTIVCRRMPDFIGRVMDAKEQMRFYTTIQRQVEGELVVQLRSGVSIRDNRQQTREIREDIIAAGVAQHVNVPELQTMLNMAKTISFDFVRRQIHIFFFDRATARKYQDRTVPFKHGIYRVSNPHGPASGSVWNRQKGRDGVRRAAQRQYVIDMFNVTRFTDVGRLAAYLKRHLQAEFEMEDLDTCTPNSRTSTVWRLKIKSAECPQFLRGVVRIIWYGRPLVLKHPYVRQRRQCLRCGNLGHTMAWCGYADAQLNGPGSQTALDQEVAELEDLAKPFESFEEIKKSAAQRLQLQEQTERKAREAVKPSLQEAEAQPTRDTTFTDKAPVPQQTDVESKRETQRIPPLPKPGWVAVPKARGRTMYVHHDQVIPRGAKSAARFAECVDDSEARPNQDSNIGRKAPLQDVINISSEDEDAGKQQAAIAPADKELLHLVEKKPPKLQGTPQLVALKQRERNTVAMTALAVQETTGGRIPMAEMEDDTYETFDEIETGLGLREVATPASGNCMAMALAQAEADQSLAAHDTELEIMTAAIKRGICWSAQLNINEQFNHYTRQTTLVNMERGWMGMSPQESSRQFKWYLEEYAATPSFRKAGVSKYNWGCSELLATAANFLQRKIFVLAYNTDDKENWYCSMYKPSLVTRGKKTYAAGSQAPMELERCLALIRRAKRKAKLPPIVLRFWGRHYSALVHSDPLISQEPAQPDSQEEKTESRQQAENEQKQPEADSQEQGSVKDASQEPWNPDQWNGNVEELRARLMGMTIPHELKCEIHFILEKADPDRYAELLSFLVNTASQLSEADRDRLLRLNDGEAGEDEVRRMMQKYQIPKVILDQWRGWAQRAAHEEASQEDQEDDEDSFTEDSTYSPSQDTEIEKSIVVRRNDPPVLRSDAQKRPHSVTPAEGDLLRQMARSKTAGGKQAKRPSSVRNNRIQEDQQTTRWTQVPWPDMWNKMQEVWPRSAQMNFPTVTSTAEEWSRVAVKEPLHLLHMVQRFHYSAELLAEMNETVREAWTAGWRRDCILNGLTAYRIRTTDKVTRVWLEDWKKRIQHSSQQGPEAQVDSREDWAKLQSRGYGKDEVLKLCSSGNKGRLANNLLCALVYEKEIRILTDQEDDSDNGSRTRLVRHFQAMKTVPGYKQAFAEKADRVDWQAFARFLSQTLEYGASERDYQCEG